MKTLQQIASVGYDGTLYIFPPWADGSVQIMAATGSGSAVRVILDSEAVKGLTEVLIEAANAATETAGSSQ
jgi:hypothetical protein